MAEKKNPFAELAGEDDDASAEAAPVLKSKTKLKKVANDSMTLVEREAADESPKSDQQYAPYIIVAFIALLIGGAAAFFWQEHRYKSELEQNKALLVAQHQGEIIDVQKTSGDIVRSEKEEALVEIQKLEQQLLQSRFVLALKDALNIETYVVHPDRKTEFYYLSEANGVATIFKYEVKRDASYQANKQFSVVKTSEGVFDDPLDENETWELIGVVADKLVLAQIPADQAKAECFNPWVNYQKKLDAIDLTKERPELEPYVVPTDILNAAVDQVNACKKGD